MNFSKNLPGIICKYTGLVSLIYSEMKLRTHFVTMNDNHMCNGNILKSYTLKFHIQRYNRGQFSQIPEQEFPTKFRSVSHCNSYPSKCEAPHFGLGKLTTHLSASLWPRQVDYGVVNLARPE